MKSTRRIFIGSIAAAVAPVPATAASAPLSTAVTKAPESTELLEAYARLKAARVEQLEANSALEWLIAEWRHLWPLAPEELLGIANADGHGCCDTAECDIAGNFLRRDTSVLSTRLHKKFRDQWPMACFSILTPEEAWETINALESRAPAGRAGKTRDRKEIDRARTIQEYKHKLYLSVEYHATTERLRQASGVEKAKQRVRDADAALRLVCYEISRISAAGPEGLAIKAEAIRATGILGVALNASGIIAEMARFIQATIDLGERASA